jgi:hypothetical protein
MVVSNEISAARRFGTDVRIQTPRVRGTRKNASRPRVWPGRRCSAKNRRLKVMPRASTLAIEAITASFTSRVIRMSLSVTSPLYRGRGETANLQQLAAAVSRQLSAWFASIKASLVAEGSWLSEALKVK